MFIAHLPSGYLFSRALPVIRPLTFWVILGSVLPDLDMLYFYLIDERASHHHSYMTHRPMVWIMLLISAVILRAPRFCAVAAGGVLHMLLDSVTGAIAWGWPIWDQAFPFITVPATQDWWVMSFVLHWSFAVEVLICLAAAFCYLRQRSLKRKAPAQGPGL